MGKKISIIGQISEIDREIAMRRSVYPRQVQSGEMKREEETMLMDRILAVRETLIFCKDNEQDIRAYMAAKKVGHP